MIVQLNPDQLTQLRDEGWIFMPDYFSPEEVAVLKTESRKVFQQSRDEIYLEKDGTPRSAFAVHRLTWSFSISCFRISRGPSCAGRFDPIRNWPIYP